MFHTSAFWPAYSEPAIQRFLSGATDQPEPSRPADLDAARRVKEKIQGYLSHLETTTQAYACRSAYRDFEHDRLATLELIIEAAEANSDLRRLEGLNDHLFGTLKTLQLPAALGQLKLHLSQLEPHSRAVAAAQAELLQAFADVEATDMLDPILSDLDAYRLQLRPLVTTKFGFVPELLASFESQNSLPSRTVHDLLVVSIDRIFAGQADGWSAQLKEGAPNVHIDYDRRAIVIPAGRHFTLPHVRALIIHEIGVHIVRSLEGERSHEPLAGLGLAGYGPAEEALGVLMEHAPERGYDPISALIPMGIIGLSMQQSRPSFRDLYSLTKALLLCLANPDEATAEARDAALARAAFSRVMRLSRFGTGRIIDRSTTKYWRGLLLLHQFFALHGLSEPVLDDLFRGKYNLLDDRQLKLIKTHS